MIRLDLTRCRQHGASACFIQLDGAHKPTSACTCGAKEGWECPIDAHAIRWLNEHPDFGSSRTRPITAAARGRMRCAHPNAEYLIEVEGISATVCTKCRDELMDRREEERRPPTPIEIYALEKETGMRGCNYNTGTKATPRTCGILCEDGDQHCPRHKVMAAHLAAVAQKKLEQNQQRKRDNAAKQAQRRVN